MPNWLRCEWLAVDGGYQYAHATVTKGSVTSATGFRRCARNMGALNLRAFKPRIGTLSLQSRISGRLYDDDANTSAAQLLQAGCVRGA